MKRWLGWPTTLVVGLVALVMVVAGCGQSPSPNVVSREGNVLVVTSITPLGDFVRHVGGDRVQVEVLVPPGTSPHTFEPTPEQVKLLARADLLVLNGVGLEFWADKMIKSAGNPDLRVVVTAEGLDILQTADEEGKVGGNPHVWLDPINAALQVARIRDALVQVDPAGKDVYLKNGAGYIEDLKALDRDIMLRVAQFREKRFVAFHWAWVYFARRYGLEQVAVIERMPGSEPSPGDIAQVVEAIRGIGAKAIFAEPQLSPRVAEAIAAETGAQVLFLNPLGEPPDYDYIRTMQHNVEQLEKALR